jgi:hypothetical protein
MLTNCVSVCDMFNSMCGVPRTLSDNSTTRGSWRDRVLTFNERP